MDERGTNGALADAGLFAWMGLWKGQTVVTRAIDRTLRDETGFSLTWGEVLSRLGAAPDNRLRMQELARQVFVSKSAVTQIVSQMARHGLVERHGDPTNLRITYAALTDEGRRVLRSSTATFLGAIQEHFARHVSAEEARVIGRAMNRVITALGEEPDTPDGTDLIGSLYREIGATTPDETAGAAGTATGRDRHPGGPAGWTSRE